MPSFTMSFGGTFLAAEAIGVDKYQISIEYSN